MGITIVMTATNNMKIIVKKWKGHMSTDTLRNVKMQILANTLLRAPYGLQIGAPKMYVLNFCHLYGSAS